MNDRRREIYLAVFSAVLSVLIGYLGSAIESFTWTKFFLILALMTGTVGSLVLITPIGLRLKKPILNYSGVWRMTLDVDGKGGKRHPQRKLILRQSGSKVAGKVEIVAADGRVIPSVVFGEVFQSGALTLSPEEPENDIGLGVLYLAPTLTTSQVSGIAVYHEMKNELSSSRVELTRDA